MGGGDFPRFPPFFIKVDNVGLSIYNRGLEAMPMISETWFLLIGLAGLIVGILECLRGDLK
tara:strand:+ start:2298 stop:2480 length:183 start_codon:yes stop_codon:yes gene_type:complete